MKGGKVLTGSAMTKFWERNLKGEHRGEQRGVRERQKLSEKVPEKRGGIQQRGIQTKKRQ